MAEATVTLASTIREVQVFRSGALVTREAALRPGTEGLLALEGLPLCLDDESVRVSLVAEQAGPLPAPTDVRAELVVPPLGALLEPPSLDEVRAVERRIAEARHGAQVIDGELARLDGLSLGLPSWDGKDPPRPAPAKTYEGVIEWTARLRQARLEERDALAVTLRAAQEELARLQRREAEARARRDARADAVSKRVVLRLRGEALGRPAALRVEYRVPGAWWVPSYVLRLSRDGRSAQLALRAHVTQRSGEPWERVRLFLSTADWLRETELPELRSLRIGRQQPAPAKRAWRDPPVAGETLLEGLRKAQAAMRAAPDEGSGEGALEVDDLVISHAGEDADESSFDDDGDPFDGAPAPEPELAKDVFRNLRSEEAEERAAPMARRAPAAAAPAMPMKSMAAPPPPVMQPMPVGAASMAFGGVPELKKMEKADRARGGPPGGGGGALPKPRPPADGKPAGVAPDTSFLRYGALALPRWHEGHALRPLTWDDLLPDLVPVQRVSATRRLSQAVSQAREASSVSLPALAQGVAQSSGAYDHRYDGEGLVDVPSDGDLHNVPLLSASAPVRTTLVVVPRESDQAVRMATLTNPLESPLLAGPAEVYLADEFLVTAPLRTVPVGGDLTVGLGLEPALKVARNTFFEEKTTGLLGGGLALEHRVVIDLASRLQAPVDVEVREVVPLKADADQAIEVADEASTPAWEKLVEQEGGGRLEAGRRWRVTLRPGEEKKLVASYTLKLDGKNEVVGGNRRG